MKDKIYYVYRYLGKDNEVLYVGITERELHFRIKQHESDKNGLPEAFKEIEFAVVNTYTDMIIYELYLINKYKPKFNVSDKFVDNFSYDLPELKWKSYSEYKNKLAEQNKWNTNKRNKNEKYEYRYKKGVIRIDENLKRKSEILLKSAGLTVSTALEMFFRQVIIQRKIPFEIKCDPEIDIDDK